MYLDIIHQPADSKSLDPHPKVNGESHGTICWAASRKRQPSERNMRSCSVEHDDLWKKKHQLPIEDEIFKAGIKVQQTLDMSKSFDLSNAVSCFQ